MKTPSLQKKPHPKGFAAIIALGILALLAIFGVLIQAGIMRTYAQIKSTNEYYIARDLADSAFEMLLTSMGGENAYGLKIKTECDCSRDEGDNMICRKKINDEEAEIEETAESNSESGDEDDGDEDVCIKVGELLKAKNKEGVVVFEVDGRSDVEFEGSGGDNGLFTVPEQGKGDAGKNCESESSQSLNNSENACNWNKLVYGSSSTDRVTVPIYTRNSPEGEPINSFEQSNDQTLIFYLRTPCKPCEYLNSNAGGLGGTGSSESITRGKRVCQNPQEENICDNGERYDVVGSDEELEKLVVVQWQMNGVCQDVDVAGIAGEPYDCGGTGYNDSSQDDNSAIKAWHYIIQGNSLNLLDKRFQDNFSKAFEPNTDDISSTLFSRSLYQNFTFFLSEKLKTENNMPLPYLEYRLISSNEIGYPKINYNVSIAIRDGSSYSLSKVLNTRGTLIDFAVQN